ncbi:hypothetical protein PIB30_087303 [Stylosanthes scabra]|uniref:PB1-like domain-containing protein n=1 Tax=Stylosanthes scabra TaxID=79078 RepID=A0ABU6VX07_9FABA|nr:hypothetical protein [Stylosanthes scabra]
MLCYYLHVALSVADQATSPVKHPLCRRPAARRLLIGGSGYNRHNEIYWLEPGFDLRNGLRLLRNDYDSLRMRESALRNRRRVDLYFEHEVIANPEVIEPVEVSDDSQIEVGDGYVSDVEAGGGNQEKEAANKVLCVSNHDAPAIF